MNKILTLVVAIIVSSAALTACETVEKFRPGFAKSSGDFVPGLPDVPLPKNFIVDTEKSSFFDSPEGRIAEVKAEGFLTPDEVTEFYAESMPQFGWTKIGTTAFKKEGELILITPTKTGTITDLKYQLRPSL